MDFVKCMYINIVLKILNKYCFFLILKTLLATPLELEQGWWRCAGVYIGGGIAGALGASVVQPSLYMVGASAGVYALLVSHVANVLVVRISTVLNLYKL